MDPLVGKVLDGRFTVLEQIGTGGMGRVYKALQAPLDRLVALKVLNPNYGAGKDPGFQQRFFLEASMTSKLRHPNTITIIDYGRTEDGMFFIAMEYIEGQTLSALLSQTGAIPWMRALHIGQQICRSLREAHRMGVVHRDLKPANVMVVQEETDHDQIKVLDFGLVKSFMPEKPLSPELTQSGVLLGSPQYMAPEQARGLADPRSDIYSLGLLLYQMLAGRPPFVGRESIDVIVKHIREAPPPLRAPRPELEFPDDVRAMVMRCLEKAPERRPQSMDEVLDAMRRLGINGGLSGVFNDPRVSSGTRSAPPLRKVTEALMPPGSFDVDLTESGVRSMKRTQALLWATGCIAALTVGLGGLYMLNRQPTPKTTPLPEVQAAPAPPVPNRPATPTPRETPQKTKPTPIAPVIPRPRSTTFRVMSEPTGAKVSMEGRTLGKTPLQFELPRNSSAKLTFNLDGYVPTTVTAEGVAEEISLSKKLEKRPAAVSSTARPKPAPPPSPKPKPNGNGYKDDPYQ
ncbi:MAG: protein kinase domain-containing protein [Myxococcaceae bacterium]